jgi:hypothetical protein
VGTHRPGPSVGKSTASLAVLLRDSELGVPLKILD